MHSTCILSVLILKYRLLKLNINIKKIKNRLYKVYTATLTMVHFISERANISYCNLFELNNVIVSLAHLGNKLSVKKQNGGDQEIFVIVLTISGTHSKDTCLEVVSFPRQPLSTSTKPYTVFTAVSPS